MTIGKSLSLRLLVIFIAAALIMLLVITFLFSRGLRTEWRQSLRPHLAQYVHYVLQDLGDPPSIARANDLAQSLPVDIHIYRAQVHQHSTNNERLNLDALKFSRALPPRALTRTQQQKNFRSSSRGPLPPLQFTNSEHRTLVRIQLQDHDVYIDLDRRLSKRGRHRQHLWLVPLTLVLLLSALYVLLRRQLSPIAEIKHGVMRMSEGDLHHRIPIHRDDDLGQLGESVNSMSAQIQALLDAKRTLLLSVSHELRSPLTRAHLAAEMLPTSTNRERVLDDLRLLDSLIEALIESERLQNEHSVLNIQTLDFLALIQNCAADVQLEYGESVGHIEFQFQESADFHLDGDQIRLRLLCRNLLNNAVQHGHSLRDNRKGPQAFITISLEVDDDNLVCKIVDEGSGVAQEELAALTEPFYRPDPSRAHGTGGVGLGLSLAAIIANAHNGALKLDSPARKGKGFSATLSLPRNNGSV